MIIMLDNDRCYDKKKDPNKISSFGIILMAFDNIILPALFLVLQTSPFTGFSEVF